MRYFCTRIQIISKFRCALLHFFGLQSVQIRNELGLEHTCFGSWVIVLKELALDTLAVIVLKELKQSVGEIPKW